ncbi:four-carbon acid sugar kinase family protein [Acidiphilium sp. PA]|uniref:3-oxo-tetronate kinase n=1 Tax=Acidiphilium sp. PA TaxID=2871705 RepID=UPI002244D9FC|nr:3-oxo-tetronate kinase [Acidiphilium sp. PA]MCW8305833.1 four-carbon acid sugar kinase family protein [Acidiphilium sp. PA]
MSLKLGCIADDYTGASDLANTLTRQGLRTIQTIGVPAASLALGDVDAVVVALKTRSVPAADAVARSLTALGWLRGEGAVHVMFKICSTFDSTDAGNIGPVTEALAAALDAPVVPVTPAFPETGRTVFQGHLFVGSRPLHESPLKDHPLNPMRDSDLVRVLARQSAWEVGLVALDCVERGAAAITARLAALGDAGVRSAIVDAVSERNLIALGEAAFAMRLSTGASGLGLGLARAAVGAGQAAALPAWPDVDGHAAIIAGSCSAATLEQIEAVAGVIPVARLDIDRLLGDSGYTTAMLEWAAARLAAGPVLLSSSATPEVVGRLQSVHGAEVGARIEAALADLAAGLVGRGVRRLIVAGGETSGAVIDRLGVTALEIGGEIAPGVPLLRSLGGETMLFALKSGNFGGPGFFRAALGAMGLRQ